jgi:hypothetical protein
MSLAQQLFVREAVRAALLFVSGSGRASVHLCCSRICSPRCSVCLGLGAGLAFQVGDDVFNVLTSYVLSACSLFFSLGSCRCTLSCRHMDKSRFKKKRALVANFCLCITAASEY